jgi:hypothetical protein
VEKLYRKDPGSKITVVDRSRRAIQNFSHLPIETAVCDGISYLDRYLSEGRPAGYVLPAVPFHLAFELILSRLKPSGAKRTKIPPLSGLPNSATGRTGDLYTSLANFTCPEDCPEPSQYCTITGEKRQKPLHKILKDLSGSFESKVIRSEQLGPGMGGFRPAALLAVLEDLQRRSARSRLFLISTASRCHAVTSGLSFS